MISSLVLVLAAPLALAAYYEPRTTRCEHLNGKKLQYLDRVEDLDCDPARHRVPLQRFKLYNNYEDTCYSEYRQFGYKCNRFPMRSGVQTRRKTTKCDLASGKELIYLDRHHVDCGAGWVLSSWTFTGKQGCSGNNMQMIYYCVKGNEVSSSSFTRTTSYQPGFKPLEYLDRHDVNCGSGYGIRSFKVHTASGNRIRFVYTCSKLTQRYPTRSPTTFRGNWDDLLIGEYAMLYSHDAATGNYFNAKSFNMSPVVMAPYVMTQIGSITKQLNCGARGFDIRVLRKNNELYTYHGDVPISYKFEDILKEMMKYQDNTGAKEILAATLRCDDPDAGTKTYCWRDLKALVKKLSNNQLEVSTGNIDNLKVGAIRKDNRWGILLSTRYEDNYDENIKCYGRYDGEQLTPKSDKAWDRLKNHMLDVSKRSRGRGLWQVQAHWQYDAGSITWGIVHGSSIIKDEEQGHVNDKLRDLVQSFEKLNLLGVDHVCDQGPALRKILNDRNTDTAIAKQRRRLKSRLEDGEVLDAEFGASGLDEASVGLSGLVETPADLADSETSDAIEGNQGHAIEHGLMVSSVDRPDAGIVLMLVSTIMYFLL